MYNQDQQKMLKNHKITISTQAVADARAIGLM